MTRNFKKFLKKKWKEKNEQPKRNNKKFDVGSSNFTYFRCGKQGHIKVECPNLSNKEKGLRRRIVNEENLEDPTSCGKTIIHHLATLQGKMKKLTCV